MSDKLSKIERKRQNAQGLFRQGLTFKQIAKKMEKNYTTIKYWIQPFIKEVKNKYAEGI